MKDAYLTVLVVCKICTPNAAGVLEISLVPGKILILYKQERQIVARYARLTPSCNDPRNFKAIASSVGDMHQTKFKYVNKQRAITQKLRKQ